MAPRSSTRSRGRPRSRRIAASAVTLALASSLLAACGGDSGKPELVWYINPDAGGQDAVAEKCSTDEYTSTTQVLPQDAKTQLEEQGTFKGAMDAATWEDKLVVFPFWSNTQVLWYRKSFVEKAGLDMSQPVTWDQIIQAAADNGGQIGVQANKYEGYSVWINALIEGAGGQLVENADKGVDLTLTIDSKAGEDAAKVIEELAGSEAAPPDLSVSNEGTAGSTFGGDNGSFMVNWTYIFHNYDETAPEVADDIGYTRYPQTVQGEESRPPYGGIGIAVSEFSDDKDLALEAA